MRPPWCAHSAARFRRARAEGASQMRAIAGKPREHTFASRTRHAAEALAGRTARERRPGVSLAHPRTAAAAPRRVRSRISPRSARGVALAPSHRPRVRRPAPCPFAAPYSDRHRAHRSAQRATRAPTSRPSAIISPFRQDPRAGPRQRRRGPVRWGQSNGAACRRRARIPPSRYPRGPRGPHPRPPPRARPRFPRAAWA